MKFTNPWIDPRVQFVRSSDAQAYLRKHGWNQVPFPRPEILMFAGPLADNGKPITQVVPADEEGDDYVQCIVELITTLALLEERTAMAVLDDILVSSHANGPVRSDTKRTHQVAKTKRRQRKE